MGYGEEVGRKEEGDEGGLIGEGGGEGGRGDIIIILILFNWL